MGKKIYITESQFSNLVESKQEKKKKKKAILDVVKANRRARREEAREIYGNGWGNPKTHVATTDKVYTRKGKKKFKYNGQSDDD